jgi:hypothetical protein
MNTGTPRSESRWASACGDGLAGAGGAGDQPMAVGEPGQERKLDFFVLRQKHA